MTKAAAVKELKAKILAKRPILAGLFERFRGVTVAEYDRVLAPSAAPADPARKQEFIQAVSEEAGRHFPAEAAASVAAQLQDEYMVSTAEHHGPLTHPFFVHSNLLAAAKPRKNIIILAVGNVSLNNSSYPRGLVFHSGDGRQHHLPFFPWRERMASVFGQRAFNQTDLNRLDGLISDKVRSGELTEVRAAGVRRFIDKVYGQDEILRLPDYNHQVVKTNDRLWQEFFSRSGFTPPRLVTLQLEDVVLGLLKRHHIFSKTEIHELIFNHDIHRLLEQYADGLPGNFSRAEQKGTFLFWHLPPKSGSRQQLWLTDGYLVSVGGYRLKLKPETVAQAMERGELIPGTFLSLLLLSEYYGVKCLGGFSQGTYLTRMHEAYNLMRGRPAKDFDPNHSSGLRSDFVLGFFAETSGLAAGQRFGYGAAPRRPVLGGIFSTIGKLTLEEAMAPLFPEFPAPFIRPASSRPNFRP